mgnify:CR=1 FL=1
MGLSARSHALVIGLETPEAEPVLQSAFRIDAQTHGSSVEGFIQRWVPADLVEVVAPLVRQALSRPPRSSAKGKAMR